MSSQSSLNFHPNGKPIAQGLIRPQRDDNTIFANIFPDTELGKTLHGLLILYLTKQEPRMGWAQKSLCEDSTILAHPNETVASHQWGIILLIQVLSRCPQFSGQLPEFDRLKAIEMASIHDVPELKTGDITPRDGISLEDKHKLESDAMDEILVAFPKPIQDSMHKLYSTYEIRLCNESKFVKDCDKLDFILHSFMLERQGFIGCDEFYYNTMESTSFFTTIAKDLANLILSTRNELLEKGLLYQKSPRNA